MLEAARVSIEGHCRCDEKHQVLSAGLGRAGEDWMRDIALQFDREGGVRQGEDEMVIQSVICTARFASLPTIL
jgi:hypothetical protein